jgi:hypothetical protein
LENFSITIEHLSAAPTFVLFLCFLCASARTPFMLIALDCLIDMLKQRLIAFTVFQDFDKFLGGIFQSSYCMHFESQNGG